MLLKRIFLLENPLNKKRKDEFVACGQNVDVKETVSRLSKPSLIQNKSI